jgi:hypothetical protein
MHAVLQAIRVRASRYIVLCCAVVGGALLVLLSPTIVDKAFPHNTDWDRLSRVGGAYGAIAALIAGVGLCGIALSVRMQAQSIFLGREHATWTTFIEITRMALDEPLYLECWEPPVPGCSPERWKQHNYTNLVFLVWNMSYEIGSLNAMELRLYVRNVFRGEIARWYWETAREDWRMTTSAAGTKRSISFFDVVDAEHAESTASGMPGAALP